MFPIRRIRLPYRKRPIQPTYGRGSSWFTWLVQDQQIPGRTETTCSAGRPNVLDQDLTISGNVIAHLFASTSGSDSDWVVKLIDVYPDSNPEDPKMAGLSVDDCR